MTASSSDPPRKSGMLHAFHLSANVVESNIVMSSYFEPAPDCSEHPEGCAKIGQCRWYVPPASKQYCLAEPSSSMWKDIGELLAATPEWVDRFGPVFAKLVAPAWESNDLDVCDDVGEKRCAVRPISLAPDLPESEIVNDKRRQLGGCRIVIANTIGVFDIDRAADLVCNGREGQKCLWVYDGMARKGWTQTVPQEYRNLLVRLRPALAREAPFLGDRAPLQPFIGAQLLLEGLCSQPVDGKSMCLAPALPPNVEAISQEAAEFARKTRLPAGLVAEAAEAQLEAERAETERLAAVGQDVL